MTEDHHNPQQEVTSGRDSRVNRRSFLTLLAQGSVAAAVTAAVFQTVRFLSFKPPDSELSIVPLGQPDSYAKDSWVYVPEARLYVGHDNGGLFALDAVCPHLGCLVEPGRKDGFVCPCHGSRFDADGKVRTGPATKSLSYLHMWREDDGQLMTDRAEVVDATTRLIP